MSAFDESYVHETVVGIVSGVGEARPACVRDEEDIFAAYGMNSLETFRAIVALERAFDIEIGADPSDFDRVRTFGELKRLVCDKLAERGEERA